ncbi:hypothetical protein ABKN59_008069, partial [Abortiporus biennis]
MSMLTFGFYSSDLVEISLGESSSSAQGFVDDTMCLAIADDLQGAYRIIDHLLGKPGGAFDWELSHDSPYELSKWAATVFSNRPEDLNPPPLLLHKRRTDGTVATHTVVISPSHTFLGVVIDCKLRWTQHAHKVIANATWWSSQIYRMARVNKGLASRHLRRLYLTVAVPRFTYAADIWYTPIHSRFSSTRKAGSVGLAKRLTSVQRRVALSITGAMRTTSVRLASLPPSHPLYPHIQKAARRQVKRHRSPLHNIFRITRVIPSSVETIQPFRRRPNYRSAFTTHIDTSKGDATKTAEHHELRTPIRVF